MRRVICAVALMLGIAVLSLPAHTQDGAKMDVAIKPAPSVSQAVLEAWNDIGRRLKLPDDAHGQIVP